MSKLTKNAVSLDLLKKMLKKKPSERFTAKDCLEHEFFDNMPSEET